MIVEFNGQRVESAQDLISKVAAATPDQTVSIGYLRENGANLESKNGDGQNLANGRQTDRCIDEQRPPKAAHRRHKAEQKPFGLTLAELTPMLAANYKLEGLKGLVVKEINPASFIADVKNSIGDEALGEGDLIQRINRVNVTDLKTFTQIVAKLKVGDPVVLHVISYIQSRQSGRPQLKIVQFTVK